MKLAVVLITASLSAFVADPSYFGTWKIDSAKAGPWWTDAKKPDPAEMNGLVGKSITISAAGITGPRALACKEHKYVVKDYPADMLFQGAFEEMQRKDKSADPAKLAASLGFKGTQWKTLETGCGNELDFHFIDPTTAAFGLNNYVYILKKQ